MKKYVFSLLAFLVMVAILPGTGISANDTIIPFKARALSGESVDLAKIAKKQPVMLFFWASW